MSENAKSDALSDGGAIVNTCRDCGCTDLRACEPDGCSWHSLDESKHLGVCTVCEERRQEKRDADAELAVEGRAIGTPESRQIRAFAWNPATEVLTIEFIGCRAKKDTDASCPKHLDACPRPVYTYQAVPRELVSALALNESRGRFFNQNIKAHPDLFAYEKTGVDGIFGDSGVWA